MHIMFVCIRRSPFFIFFNKSRPEYKIQLSTLNYTNISHFKIILKFNVHQGCIGSTYDLRYQHVCCNNFRQATNYSLYKISYTTTFTKFSTFSFKKIAFISKNTKKRHCWLKYFLEITVYGIVFYYLFNLWLSQSNFYNTAL